MRISEVIARLEDKHIFVTRRQLLWAEKKLNLNPWKGHLRDYGEEDYCKLETFMLLKLLQERLVHNLVDVEALHESLRSFINGEAKATSTLEIRSQ
ncbi:MAG: hypothetical protein HY709_08925 [Candidatus Latescibacteria bacterium]|nr:hypothetical protein [Candidatus Latescibacterota bacterium]